jgi:hypothetical protein
MYIKCVFVPKKLIPYQPLTIGKRYLLIGIEYSGQYRIVDDHGEPVLFSKRWFEKIDHCPENWIKKEFDDGQYFIYPQELQEKYFFESWFDGDPVVREKLKKYVDSIMQQID